MADPGEVVFLLGAAGALIGWRVLSYRGIRDHATMWAQSEGYEVVSAGYVRFGGEFFFRKSNSQRVCRLVVKDERGVTATVDVRVGHWALGSLVPEIAVQWVGDPPHMKDLVQHHDRHRGKGKARRGRHPRRHH